MFCYGLLNGLGGFNGIRSAWPWMLGASILKIAIIGLMVFLVGRLIVNSGRNNDYAMNNQAIEILQQRYARGEVSEEEYIQKSKILKK